MTRYMRELISLVCLMCRHNDFDVSAIVNNRYRVLKCKKCGFMFKESQYFHPVSGFSQKHSNDLNKTAL